MATTVTLPEPIINVTVQIVPPANVTIRPTSDVKVVQVQPATIQGQKGDSPDRSIYSKKEILAYGPDLEIDAETGTTFFIRLKSDIGLLNIVNWPNDGKTQRIALYLQQDVANTYNITWPANVKWSYGEYPVLTPKPNAVDCIVFDTFDGGQTVYGGIVGIDYA